MSKVGNEPASAKDKQVSSRRTQAQRRASTQKRILNAAISLLKDKGYAGFRINDVAEKAQVSRGAQTHHFPTKESLLLAALEQVYFESQDDTFEAMSALGAESDLIAALFQNAEKFFLGASFSIALSLLNVGEGNESLGRQTQELARKYRLPIERAWVKIFVAIGVDQNLAENIVESAFCLYRGLAVRQLLSVDPDYVERQVEFCEKLLREELKRHA